MVVEECGESIQGAMVLELMEVGEKFFRIATSVGIFNAISVTLTRICQFDRFDGACEALIGYIST